MSRTSTEAVRDMNANRASERLRAAGLAPEVATRDQRAAVVLDGAEVYESTIIAEGHVRSRRLPAWPETAR